MKRSPLASTHLALGATFQTAGEWEVVAHYGDPPAECRSIRQTVGLADLSRRGKIRLTGKDRAEFLHGQVTNDIKKLQPGEGVYAVFTTPKAKILGEVVVSCLSDALWLAVPGEIAAAMVAHLDRFLFTADVMIEDLTDRYACLSLQGPVARKALEAAIPGVVPPAPYGVWEGAWKAYPLLVVGSASTGEEGYDCYLPVEGAEALWGALREAGKPWGLQPVGLEALEILRIETGIPRYGAELDETVMPLEARLDHAISYTKGCYVGQETIARIHYQGHVNKILVGLKGEGAAIPSQGDVLYKEGQEVGRVTSAVLSPTLEAVVALGYAKRASSEPGTALTIQTAAGDVQAVVTELPFYMRTG
ncbi:MAG: aminomethyl transferase family protein [Nitrospirae bacterium]|nr:aminomethyl transferase family protein [Nitrospirota bacterium]